LLINFIGISTIIYGPSRFLRAELLSATTISHHIQGGRILLCRLWLTWRTVVIVHIRIKAEKLFGSILSIHLSLNSISIPTTAICNNLRLTLQNSGYGLVLWWFISTLRSSVIQVCRGLLLRYICIWCESGFKLFIRVWLVQDCWLRYHFNGRLFTGFDSRIHSILEHFLVHNLHKFVVCIHCIQILGLLCPVLRLAFVVLVTLNQRIGYCSLI
jgi:hypothetical protein